MKRNGDSTPLSESNTNGERSWLNFPDMDTNLWAEIQWLENQSQRPSTPTPATLPKAFHKEPGYMPSRGRQSLLRGLWDTPKVFQNFSGGWNVVCNATAVTKTALGIIQLWLKYFAASFFMALDNVNVSYLKLPKKHRGPHKRSWRATCGLRAACLRPLI